MDKDDKNDKKVSLPGAEETDQGTTEFTKHSSDTASSVECSERAIANDSSVVGSVQLECVDESNSGEKSNYNIPLVPFESDHDCVVQQGGTENLNTSRIDVLIVPKKIAEDHIPDFSRDHDTQLEQQKSVDSYCSDSEEKPPLPLQTYLWEDIKRKKQQGGYPWTHLYKQELGPDEEPEIILKYKCSPSGRRKFEEQFLHLEDSTADELSDQTPTVDDGVETVEDLPLDTEGKVSTIERIQEEEITPVITSEAQQGTSFMVKSILKRPHLKIFDKKDTNKETPNSSSSAGTPTKIKCCHPFVEKIKTMADKQLHKVTHKRTIKKVPVTSGNEIVLEDEQTILKLRESPKSPKRDFVSYIEKQESDELDIVPLEESPSETRKRKESERDTTVVPDEIIQLPSTNGVVDTLPPDEEYKNREPVEEPVCRKVVLPKKKNEPPPPKMPRVKKKEHVYEDIEDYESEETPKVTPTSTLERKLKRQPEISGFDPVLQEFLGNETLQISLKIQDDQIFNDVQGNKTHLDELVTQSSEEHVEEKQVGLLAPMSSIDSTSSDEGRNKVQLSALVEESDIAESCDEDTLQVKEQSKNMAAANLGPIDIKSILKAETSPGAPKKISFSPSTTTDDDRLEDVTDVIVDAKVDDNRWSKMSDHEYEPIGEPFEQSSPKTADEPNSAMDELRVNSSSNADKVSIQDIQDEMEARFNSPTPTTASGTDADIHTSQVNSSALESLPLKKESRQKRMMMSAQERSRKLSSKFKTQAGKLKNRMSNMKKPKRASQVLQDGTEEEEATPTGTEGSQATPVGTEGGSQATPESNLPSEEMETEEPAKEKHRFKTPERFRNMHMPKINRPKFNKPAMPKMPPIPKMPQMPKMKVPEMPKFKKPNFSRPEMPNFHVQEKFNSLRLKRSKSLKEPPAAVSVETASESYTTESTPPKKKFDITFGTYPRILSKLKRQKTESSVPRLRQDTPPPLEFSTLPKAGVQRTGKVVSRYPEEETASDTKYTDNESAPEQQFDSEQDLTNRESSVERRMKLHFQQKAADEDTGTGFLLTDEQKQMEEFDKENREIHQISKAKEQDFKQRKPIERQESDLTSEEEKQFWRSPLGQKIKQSYTDNCDESFELDMNDAQLLVQGNGLGGTSTPHTNQETQSSGSSAAKRMKDVLDEIEQNEMYLQQGGNEHMEYAHSAIREGLENPVNTLARMGRFDSSYDEDYSAASDKVNYPPVKPGRTKKPMKFNISADSEDIIVPNIDDEDDIDRNNYDDDYFKNFPPSKPLRKQPLVPQYSDEIELAPYAKDYPGYYENERMKGIEQPNIVLNNNNNYDENFDLSLHDSELMMDDVNFAVPPTPPRRRKKRFRDFSTSLDRGGENDGIGRFTERSVSNTILPDMEQQQNLLIYHTQHEYNVPLAQEEHFVTPIPTPRRSRSQSQMSRMTDDDRTSRGADSNILDAQLEAMADSKFIVDMQETNGYAIIRKEPPPRPPAPLRRKRSTKSLGERQFFTMPSRGKQTDLDAQPMRPTRNYSTLLPTRPPRRKSATSLVDTEPAPSEADGSQYEEINDGGETKSHSKLQSGEILNKMKDRPLPPPPRPPRERKHPKHRYDDDDDRDGGGEKIRVAESASESDVLSQYVEEIDKETQTDPLPDDFQCEEFEITPDMRTITPTQAKTTFLAYDDSIPPQDIHSIASNDDEALSRGLAKFRESSQRSYSERSRGSTSKPSSRPTTPALITLERKISTSTTPDNVDQMTISATLMVQPLELTDGRDEDEIMEALIREQEEEERLKLQLELEQELEQEKQQAFDEQAKKLRELEELAKQKQRELEETEREKQRQLEEEERQKILQELQEAREADERQRFEAEMRAIREERKREEERKQIEEARKNLELERQQLEQESLRREQEIQHMLEEVKRQAELERLQAESNAATTEKLENREEIIRSNLLSEHKPKTDSFDKSLVEELDLQVVDSGHPVAPPRRKTSGGDEQQAVHSLELSLQQRTEVMETHRLHLSSLEIDKLNVTALQAGKIVASELETQSINTQTIHSESGNLRTVDDLPAGLIEEIVGRVIEQQHQEQQKLQKVTQAETDAKPNETSVEKPDPSPPRPPQPYFHPDYLPYSMPLQSFYQLRNYSDEEPGTQQLPSHASPPIHRRKRHQRKRDSTSEDEYLKEHEKSKRSSRQNTHSPEPPTAMELSGQLVQRTVRNLGDFGQQLMAALRASSKDENRRDLHVALIILIVIFAGLIMLGFTTNKAVHHHHWDYFNPPEGKP